MSGNSPLAVIACASCLLAHSPACPAQLSAFRVDQSYNDPPPPGGVTTAYGERDEPLLGQSFTPTLDTVSTVAFIPFTPDDTIAFVELRRDSQTGPILGTTPHHKIRLGQEDKPFSFVFAESIPVTPGTEYWAIINHVSGSQSMFWASSPGLYPYGRSVVDSQQFAADLWFSEGASVPSIPRTTPQPPATLRVTTLTNTTDINSAQAFQTPARGPASLLITGDQQSNQVSCQWNPENHTLEVSVNARFLDNLDETLNRQTLQVDCRDTISITNPHDVPVDVAVDLNLDGVADLLAGATNSFTLIAAVGSNVVSRGGVFAAGNDVPISLGLAQPLIITIPPHATYTADTRAYLSIAAVEGADLNLGDTLSMTFSLPEGLSMTSQIGTPLTGDLNLDATRSPADLYNLDNLILNIIDNATGNPDINHDGIISPLDSLTLATHPDLLNLLPADFNADHTVDLIDLSLLASHFNTPANTFTRGDTNGDGLVNLIDLSTLASLFGTSQTIPTPTTATLLALLTPALLQRRR